MIQKSYICMLDFLHQAELEHKTKCPDVYVLCNRVWSVTGFKQHCNIDFPRMILDLIKHNLWSYPVSLQFISYTSYMPKNKNFHKKREFKKMAQW